MIDLAFFTAPNMPRLERVLSHVLELAGRTVVAVNRTIYLTDGDPAGGRRPMILDMRFAVGGEATERGLVF